MMSNKFGTSALRKTVSAGTIQNAGGTGQKGYLNQLKRERPKKIIDHLGGEGKGIKKKFASNHLYKRQEKSTAKSDRMICFAILLLIAVAGFIYISSVRNSRKQYMKSPYFVEINNHLFDIQEETGKADNLKMATAVMINIRPR